MIPCAWMRRVAGLAIASAAMATVLAIDCIPCLNSATASELDRLRYGVSYRIKLFLQMGVLISFM